MSRRRAAEKRTILPDHKFKDLVLAKFMNRIMLDGKKSTSEKIVYGALDSVSQKQGNDPVEMFEQALEAIQPMVEVKSRRVGGATFQVPTEVRPERKVSLGMKWMIRYARLRHEKSMKDRLSAEIIAASKGEGASVKKKDDTHRMAEANKAFAHFRF